MNRRNVDSIQRRIPESRNEFVGRQCSCRRCRPLWIRPRVAKRFARTTCCTLFTGSIRLPSTRTSHNTAEVLVDVVEKAMSVNLSVVVSVLRGPAGAVRADPKK